MSPKLDTTVPHPARVYDYWLGGKDNYAADREAAAAAIAVNPFIVPGSYLVISHPASDIQAEVLRFDGLDLVEPGLVQPRRWRPSPGMFSPRHDVSAWRGVARKP